MISTGRNRDRGRPATAILVLLALLVTGCVSGSGDTGGTGQPSGTAVDGPTSAGTPDAQVAPGQPVTLSVLAGSELRDMEPILDEVAERSGVTLELTYTGTLTGTERILAGEDWDLAWFSHSKYLELQDDGRRVAASTPIMYSPVTIGVRRAVAERQGWADGDVTWRALADASAAGDLHFAMTDPASSNTGFTALIAVSTALADTGGAVDREDVAGLDLSPFFAGQTLTAGSSGWLADTFALEGEDLDAMVNYESVLAQVDDLVILYPQEGVVTADYPLILLDREREESYDRLVAALLDPETQRRITETTLRRAVVPGVEPPVALGRIETSEVPFPASAATIDALLFSYLDEARPPAHTIYLLDVSGSMAGDPLEQLKAALTGLTGVDQSLAGRFNRFRRREVVTMLPFSTTVGQPATFTIDDVGPESADLASIRTYVEDLEAGGDTALYAALEAGYALAIEARRSAPDRYYSIVVLSDGKQDPPAELGSVLDGATMSSPEAGDIRAFPILFGQSDEEAMAATARATGGLVFDSGGDLTAVFKTIRGYQ